MLNSIKPNYNPMANPGAILPGRQHLINKYSFSERVSRIAINPHAYNII